MRLIREFTEYDWYPNYKKIKKCLRKEKIPFVVKKTPDQDGLIYSIWVDEYHIDKAKCVVATQYKNNKKLISQENKVEKLTKNFEGNLPYNIFYYSYLKIIKSPLLFFLILLFILAMALYPIFEYSFRKV